MSGLDQNLISSLNFIASYLASKPQLEWIGPDLFLFVASETKDTVPQAVAPAVVQPSLGLDSLHFITNVIPLILPAGIVLTSLGFVLAKKLQSSKDLRNTQTADEEKNFENYIRLRRYFKNQSERTIEFLEGLMKRVPNAEPELVVFFATEDSTVTAMNLAIKLMKLIFLANGEDKKLDEIEQEHVVSGKWYGRFTISWYFLNELRSALTQKTGIIVNNFQDVHPNSAALLTFKMNELLDNAKGAYLFLIVNTEDALNHLESKDSSEDSALEWWLSEKLGPHVRSEVITGIQKEIRDKTCVIRKESLSTLMIQ
uniref:Glucose-6-phosphate 1-dehydrogenase n=1 Tax=Lygus hesperus TaxID=30085 RepID=A0A0A9XTE5_LYGHE